jgi:hypothetical protein
MIKKLNARMDGGDLLTLKKAKTAGICIKFCVGKCFFVVIYFQVEFMSNQRKVKRSLRRN